MRKTFCLLLMLLLAAAPLCALAQGEAAIKNEYEYTFTGKRYTDGTTLFNVELLDVLNAHSDLLYAMMPDYEDDGKWYDQVLRYNFEWSFHEELIEDEIQDMWRRNSRVFRNGNRTIAPDAVHAGMNFKQAQKLIGQKLFTCTITPNNKYINRHPELPENKITGPIEVHFVLSGFEHAITVVENVPNTINTYYTAGQMHTIRQTENLPTIGDGSRLYYKWFLYEYDEKDPDDDEDDVYVEHGMIGTPSTDCRLDYVFTSADNGRYLDCCASLNNKEELSEEDEYISRYYLWDKVNQPVIMPVETKGYRQIFIAPGESYTIELAPAKSMREGVPVRYEWRRDNPWGGDTLIGYTDEPRLTVTYGKEAIDMCSFNCAAGYADPNNPNRLIDAQAYDELIYCDFGTETTLPSGLVQAHYPIDLNDLVNEDIAAKMGKKNMIGAQLQEVLEEKLTAELGEALPQSTVPDRNGSQLLNVNLHIRDKGTGVCSPLSDFPEEGVELFLPYPAGTNRSSYTFHAAHVFEEDCNGFEAGDIEYPDVTADANGLRLTVMGTSPVLVSWTYVGESGVSLPQTGDDSALFAWLALAAASCIALMMKKRLAQ